MTSTAATTVQEGGYRAGHTVRGRVQDWLVSVSGSWSWLASVKVRAQNWLNSMTGRVQNWLSGEWEGTALAQWCEREVFRTRTSPYIVLTSLTSAPNFCMIAAENAAPANNRR